MEPSRVVVFKMVEIKLAITVRLVSSIDSQNAFFEIGETQVMTNFPRPKVEIVQYTKFVECSAIVEQHIKML